MSGAFALLFSEEEWTVIEFALQHFSFQADIKTQLYYHDVARKVWQRIQEEQTSVKKQQAERAKEIARRRTQGAKDGWEIRRAKQKAKSE